VNSRLAPNQIDTLAVAFERLHPQAEPFAELPANKASDAVCLPTGGTHDGRQAGARGTFEQSDHASGFGVCARRLAFAPASAARLSLLSPGIGLRFGSSRLGPCNTFQIR